MFLLTLGWNLLMESRMSLKLTGRRLFLSREMILLGSNCPLFYKSLIGPIAESLITAFMSAKL